MGDTQPFETERQARDAARQAFGEMDREDDYVSDEANQALLLAACEKAGVELGTYDQRIIRWLAGYEPSICAVVAGLVTRAAEGGQG